MVKLRLYRMGCHKNPSYRVVVADSKTKANGDYIELLGQYDPNLGTHKLNEYLCLKWLSNGAQPSDTVKSFLVESGIWKKYVELKQKKLLQQYLIDNAPVKAKKEIKPLTKPVKKDQPKPVVIKKEQTVKPVESKSNKVKEEPKKVEEQKVEQVKSIEEKQPISNKVKEEPKKVEEQKVEQVKSIEEKQPISNKVKEEPKKEQTLKINENSKLISKLSDEELEKRQSQKFEVVADDKKNENSSSTIIISLDKEHIENIINDEKEVIYFKRLPVHKFTRVLVYSKKPIGLVIGEFEVEEHHTCSKTPAWKNYGSKSIFSKKEFDEYFDGQEDAKLMIIKGFILYSSPRKLSDFKLTKGPSGFSYLK